MDLIKITHAFFVVLTLSTFTYINFKRQSELFYGLLRVSRASELNRGRTVIKKLLLGQRLKWMCNLRDQNGI